MSLLSFAAPIIGGLLGSQGSNKSETAKQIDPRLAPYVYGTDGKGGMARDTYDLYRQQMDQGGLNDLQRSGMEMQRQTLMSPQFTQGYDAMRSLGMSLMGGGVAGNPFTSSGANWSMSGGGPAVGRPSIGMGYQPFSYAQNPAMQAMNTPIQSAAEYKQANPRPVPNDAAAAIDAYLARIGYDGAGSGEMGSYGGFDGGLLGILGIDGGGQAVGNNGGMGLGSAMGGDGVSMGSAAGNAGDNGAELGGGGYGGDSGMSGSDGNGGGFGGDSGDGYAKGGKVTKKRLSGPNPKGPDDGYAALDEDEFVINAKAAKRIGYDKLHKMNKR